jgi:hypothetical protein
MPPAIPITSEYPVTQKEFNTWSHGFGGANTPWRANNRIIVGNFFAGLNGSGSWIMPTPTLPPGAQILSAELELITQAAGNGGAATFAINTVNRLAHIVTEPMRTMFGFEGWRAGRWSAFEGDLRNAAFELLTDTPDPVQIPNQAWAIRWQDSVTTEPFADKAMRKKMGGRVIGYPLPGGGDILTDGFIRLNKVGAPATTGMVVEIWSSSPALGGDAIPGTFLATSDEIPIATITAANPYPLVFSGVNQIPITAGVQYFMVVVPSQPYVPDALNYVSTHHHNAFFGQNRQRSFGVGMGLDWQNYPGAVDVETMRGQKPAGLADVTWLPDVLPAPGHVNITSDIATLVQYQVDLAEYDNDGADHRAMYFGMNQPGGGAPNRIFASFLSGAFDPGLLRVTWLPAAEDDKLADPRSRHRIYEPWTDEYYKFKYGKEKPAAEELVAEIERPNVLAEMLDQAVLDDYDARNAQNERDIAELEAYISASTDALAQDVDTAMLALGDQDELIAQLEINLVLARETLIIALDSRRKHQNLLAAIEAVIRNYY